MVIFTAQDGSICPGLDRYDTRQAATLAAGRISNVVVSGERRPVQRYIVALDPARDPDLKKRKRRQMTDANKTHAYCPRCHRRIYAGERTCDCGHQLSANWEQLFEEKQREKPEARPRGIASSPGPQQPVVAASTGAPEQRNVDAARHSEDTVDGGSLAAQLRELANLPSSGVLSDREFEQAKAKLIAS